MMRKMCQSPFYWAENRWVLGIVATGDFIEVTLDQAFFRIWNFDEPILGDTYHFLNVHLQACDFDAVTRQWHAVVLPAPNWIEPGTPLSDDFKWR